MSSTISAYLGRLIKEFDELRDRADFGVDQLDIMRQDDGKMPFRRFGGFLKIFEIAFDALEEDHPGAQTALGDFFINIV